MKFLPLHLLALVASVCFAADKPKPIAPPASATKVAGILLDDDAAEFTGTWIVSSKQPALSGKTYRHADRQSDGVMTARFTPEIPQAGRYELRLLYVATANRATNVPVTIRSADGENTVRVNQREECLAAGVPRALGVFAFEAGKAGSVTISNSDADGFVIVDGLQVVPVAEAEAERAAHAGAGFTAAPQAADDPSDDRASALRKQSAAAVAVSPLAAKTAPGHEPVVSKEPVQLAKDAKPQDVDGKSYDLIVVGGTAGGVACAVRAAREGCTVLLVQHNRHIGGMMANGLMQWDALYGGPRAPLFSELLGNIEKHYIARFKV